MLRVRSKKKKRFCDHSHSYMIDVHSIVVRQTLYSRTLQTAVSQYLEGIFVKSWIPLENSDSPSCASPTEYCFWSQRTCRVWFQSPKLDEASLNSFCLCGNPWWSKPWIPYFFSFPSTSQILLYFFFLTNRIASLPFVSSMFIFLFQYIWL